MCMCLYECMSCVLCVIVLLFVVFTCAQTCGGQRNVLNVLLYGSLPIPLRQGLPLNLGLTPSYSGSLKVLVIPLSSLRVGTKRQGHWLII